jgi:hypothetical protein
MKAHNWRQHKDGKNETEVYCTSCNKLYSDCGDKCFANHKILECVGCDGTECFVCQPGPEMHICIICGGVNESLTTECRGEALDHNMLKMVAMGQADYIDGNWERPNVIRDLRFK